MAALSTDPGCGNHLKAAAPSNSIIAMVSNTAKNGSVPCAVAADATRPVSHCITATPRNIAIVKTAIARPVMLAG